MFWKALKAIEILCNMSDLRAMDTRIENEESFFSRWVLQSERSRLYEKTMQGLDELKSAK
jgi:hypothetical protein